MSGVYIPYMKMPNDCRECPCQFFSPVTGETICDITDHVLAADWRAISFDGKPKWCPLIEVPKHGRLIDADAAAKQGWTISRIYSDSPTVNVYEVKTMTDEVLPTIIPAELHKEE